MRAKIILSVSAFFLAFFMVESTLASSMRCGVHLVSQGGRNPPSMYEVLKKCGEPTFRNGNTWTYEFTTRSRKVLRFNDEGFLMRISDK